jgi:tetratricopeptide (TPR) repeat protein
MMRRVRYIEVREDLGNRVGKDNLVYVTLLGDYAELLRRQGNYREAYPIVQRVIEDVAKRSANHPQLRIFLLAVAAETLRGGRMDEADQYYQKIQSMPDPGGFDFELLHGLVLTNLHFGRTEQAMTHSQSILEQVAERMQDEEIAWGHYIRARVLAKAGQHAEAEESDERGWEIAKSIKPQHMITPVWVDHIGVIFTHNQEHEQAHKYYQHAFNLDEEQHPADHPSIANRLVPLALSHARAGRKETALPLLERAHSIRKKMLPLDDGLTKEVEKHLHRMKQ